MGPMGLGGPLEASRALNAMDSYGHGHDTWTMMTMHNDDDDDDGDG